MEITNVYSEYRDDDTHIELDCTIEDLWDIVDALQAKNANYPLTVNQMYIKDRLSSFLREDN